MFNVLSVLRQRKGWSQERLAEELGKSQSQISRWEAGRGASESYNELAQTLQRYVRSSGDHAREWLRLLASAESVTAFSELQDLLFITAEVRVAYKMLWVVSDRPAECQKSTIRSQTVAALQDRDTTIVYWVPNAIQDELRTLRLALLDDGVSSEQLESQTKIIWTPKSYSLLPIAIADPLDDQNCIGFLSPESEVHSGLRVVVLPQQTTESIVSRLELIFREVRRGGKMQDHTHTWVMTTLERLGAKNE